MGIILFGGAKAPPFHHPSNKNAYFRKLVLATSHCLRMEKAADPKTGGPRYQAAAPTKPNHVKNRRPKKQVCATQCGSRGLNCTRDGLYYPLKLRDFNLELLPA
jgi:hypothetical protein